MFGCSNKKITSKLGEENRSFSLEFGGMNSNRDVESGILDRVVNARRNIKILHLVSVFRNNVFCKPKCAY